MSDMERMSTTNGRGARESVQLSESARKSCTVILQAMTSVGQKPVADALGVHVSTVSRMVKDGEFEAMAAALTALGLRVVPATSTFVSREWIKRVEERVRGLEYYAEIGMQAQKGQPLISEHADDDFPADIHWPTR